MWRCTAPATRRISPAERQRIVAMHERGVPAWEIADRVGCRSGSVYRILHRMRDGR
jgi:DNA-directed RNA polymerase specialized sigma24 family protein